MKRQNYPTQKERLTSTPVGHVDQPALRLKSLRPFNSQAGQTLKTSQSGVGLIEVLIAVLVLSIAFLGMAALQAVSLSTSNSALARSMATISSYSILDAMRADRSNATAGLYNQTNMLANNCPASGSTLQTLQVNQWCTQLGAKLGASASTIGNITCATSGLCTVTVQFDDSRSGSGGTSSQLVSTVAYL